MSMITLKSGISVPALSIIPTTNDLQSLASTEPQALVDLFTKCLRPSYQLPSDSAAVLRNYSFFNEAGAFLPLVQDVVLTVIENSRNDLRFIPSLGGKIFARF